jgi:hypothetical protein
MSCERYADAIIDHACGAEISPGLAAHLAGCEACKARLDAQRRLIEGLEEEISLAVSVDASDTFARGVHARLEEASRRSLRMLWWSLAGATAAILIAVSLRPAPPEIQIDTRVPSTTLTERAPMIVPPAPSEAPLKAPPTPPVHRVLVNPRPATIPTVEVIVPADRADAVARFLALVRAGAVNSPAPVEPTETEPAPSDLVVSPLSIEPIAVADVEFPQVAPAGGRGPQ